MNEGIAYAKLATRLISDLSEAESSSTDDTPLELKQLQIVLESFDDVADIVEQRIYKEMKLGSKSEHSNTHSAADNEDLGEVG